MYICRAVWYKGSIEALCEIQYPLITDDFQRVYLRVTGQPGSDYINASWINVSGGNITINTVHSCIIIQKYLKY